MIDILRAEYETAVTRREKKQEGSYTCYLFEQGIDKILKKCGEECSEVIVAAKNGKRKILSASFQILSIILPFSWLTRE